MAWHQLLVASCQRERFFVNSCPKALTVLWKFTTFQIYFLLLQLAPWAKATWTGKGLFCWQTLVVHHRDVRAGTQGRNLGQEPRQRPGGMLLPGAQPALSRAINPRSGIAYSRLGSLISTITQQNIQQTCLQAMLMRHILNWGSLFPDPRLYQVDTTVTERTS